MSLTAKKEGFQFTVICTVRFKFSLDLVDVLGSGQVNVQSKLTRGIQRLTERALLSLCSMCRALRDAPGCVITVL